ncbi:hypothetical protein IMSAGC013_02038 [Lachnospiraceae bacterium]|nr:hypothetical protein IMSAGC013_02038 [Lachnospiraceae bacterium]
MVDGVLGLFSHFKRLPQKGSYEIYNIGSGNPVELMTFIKTIEEVIGKEARKIMCEKRTGDVEKTYADITEIQRVCAFCPRTNIKDGLERFYNWYREYNRKDA